MKRIQLYLDEELWNALHFHARLNGQSVSELVRKAARDKHMGFRQYSKSHGIAISGALMAATAIQNQAALWTRNRNHHHMAELTLY